MKEKWKKILWIDRRYPRTSYILRTFVGFYLIYIVYQIIDGLKEPGATNPPAIIAAAVFLSIFCVLCLFSGILGLYQKEYKEEHEDDEE